VHPTAEHLERENALHPNGVQVACRLYPDRTRTLINKVESPDLSFRWTINPYRGCEHGCIYCYARPTHETLGFSAGLDFETRLVVKYDAAEILRRELASPKWAAEPIVLSGVTDGYQPIESRLGITRACIEVCTESRQPIAVATKNHLVVRDIDLFQELSRHEAINVALSLTTLDRELASRLEPRASSPSDRLKAMQSLAQAGVPVSVLIAPIIPGLNDQEIPQLLKASKAAGATSAGWELVRLPGPVRPLFLEWLQRWYPDRAARIESSIRLSRDGRLSDSRFGTRLHGTGPHAGIIKRTFHIFADRYGLDRSTSPVSRLSRKHFRRPGESGSQLFLFES